MINDSIANLERLAKRFSDLEARLDVQERRNDIIAERRHQTKERVDSDLPRR